MDFTNKKGGTSLPLLEVKTVCPGHAPCAHGWKTACAEASPDASAKRLFNSSLFFDKIKHFAFI